MRKLLFPNVLFSVFLILAVSGCATRRYVNEQLNEALTAEISNVRTDISNVREGVRSNQEAIDVLKIKTQEQQEMIEKKFSLVDEAISRAKEGSKVSAGKLMFEATISDETVPFTFNKSELSEDAKAELDILAEVLIQENRNVYIEIQGHTDNIGTEAYNLKLGQFRADAVKNYLHTKHEIPLNRMDSFSYGKSRPVAPNDTAENRAQNRRVVLMVME
ncbi:MAG: OmpA family protein [Desulfococcaceae bacterium]